VEQFLTSDGFTGKDIDENYTIWENKDKLRIKIPHQDKLTKEELTETLADSGLDADKFEDFIESVNDWNFFDKLIDMSLNTPSLKHPKKGD
jgi:hypothetical protein